MLDFQTKGIPRKSCKSAIFRVCDALCFLKRKSGIYNIKYTYNNPVTISGILSKYLFLLRNEATKFSASFPLDWFPAPPPLMVKVLKSWSHGVSWGAVGVVG